MRCFSQFGTICTILKKVKNIHGRALLLVKLQPLACNFTKSNTLPWVFFTFFKLYKWYQIVQRITILCLPWSQLMIINIFFSFIILEVLRKLFYWLSDVLYGTTIVSKTSWRCALFQCRFNSVKVKRVLTFSIINFVRTGCLVSCRTK